jgi:hypothetical protein
MSQILVKYSAMDGEKGRERERVHDFIDTNTRVKSILFLSFDRNDYDMNESITVMNEIKRQLSNDESVDKGTKILRSMSII